MDVNTPIEEVLKRMEDDFPVPHFVPRFTQKFQEMYVFKWGQLVKASEKTWTALNLPPGLEDALIDEVQNFMQGKSDKKVASAAAPAKVVPKPSQTPAKVEEKQNNAKNTDFNVIYYHTAWSMYGRDFHVSDLDTKMVPECAYAFFNIKMNDEGLFIPVMGDPWSEVDKHYPGDENQPFFGNFGQFKMVKEKCGMKLTLSIGGWTWSKDLSTLAADEKHRAAFCKELINIFDKYDIFDGVNVDWEYPVNGASESLGHPHNLIGPNDGDNFALLLKDVREALDKSGRNHFTVSAAVTGAPEKMEGLPVEELDKYLDEFHVMTYDYSSSSWGPCLAGHHSNLRKMPYTPYSCEESVDAYLARGVRPDKIYIGVPFYSRGFANTDGIGKDADGNVKAMSWEEGVVDYKALPVEGSTEMWDEDCQATYCYDPVTRELQSYEDVRSCKAKCDYIKEKGLKGVIVWDSSGDFPTSDPKSLTRCLYENLMK